MNKKKNIIVFFICILILIFIIILGILINLKKNNNDDIDASGLIKELEGKEGLNTYDFKISSNIYKYNYYTVKYCAETYQNAINELLNNNNELNKNKLFNMLAQEYLNEEKITLENITEKYKNYKKSDIYINEILTTNISDNISVYIVKAKLIENGNANVNEDELLIEIDSKNNTFCIYPYEYLLEKKYNQLKDGDILKIQAIDEIEKKEYNVFEDQSNRYKTIAVPYFEKLKIDLIYDSEYAYNQLDNNYKINKFNNSFEEFEKYINNNNNKILNMQIKKYARYYYDGYIQYIVVDNNGDYYIFNETSTLNYKIILDAYTIDQPDFIERYDTATDEKKAGYDINKFIQAINNKDYKYAYNCLADSFKQNKFQTQSNFEEYIKKNFYENSILKSATASKQGSYYTCSIVLENKDSEGQTMQKTFTVNLKDDRKFELSFTVE